MLNNIFTPLSGSLAQEKYLDIIANNLANINTVGFKEEEVGFKLLDPEPQTYVEPLPEDNYSISLDEVMPLKGNDMGYVGVSGVSRNDGQGSPIETRNPMDLMIDGEGYFSIHTANGTRFTRNGSFSVNADGALVDKFGNPVLGEGGNIFLSSSKVTINNHGEVYQNDELVDRILIHTVKEKQFLEKLGENYFLYNGPEDEISRIELPQVQQGFLESSNVNAVKNLTKMILAHRSFEAYQKAIKNYDSMMEKSHNTLASSRG